MGPYDRPLVPDVNAARRKYDARVKSSLPKSRGEVRRGQTIEEVMQMHKDFPWLYDETGRRSSPMTLIRRKGNANSTSLASSDYSRPRSALHRLYMATFEDTKESSEALPIPSLETGEWGRRSGPLIPQRCTMAELRDLCSAMLQRMQRLESVARMRGIDLSSFEPFDEDAALSFSANTAEPLVGARRARPATAPYPRESRTAFSDAPFTEALFPEAMIPDDTLMQTAPPKVRAASAKSRPQIDPSNIDAGVVDNMSNTIDDINTTLERLDFVFVEKGRAEEVIRKNNAATVMASAMRRTMAVNRYKDSRDILRSWRKRHGGERLATRLFAYEQRVQAIERGCAALSLRINMRMQRINFKALKRLVAYLRPTRLAQLESVNRMRAKKECAILSALFFPWKDVALGPRSRKSVRAAYEARAAKAKQKLVDQQHAKEESKRVLVTKAMVKEEMHKSAAEIIHGQRNMYRMKRTFAAWSRDYLEDLLAAKRRAVLHWGRGMLPRLFKAWTIFVEMRDEGAFVNKKWTRGSFAQGNNEHAIVEHANMLCTKHAFRALRDYMKRISEVKRRHLKCVRVKLRRILVEWRQSVKRTLSVKRVCVKTWIEYGERERRIPFRAWYVWSRERKRQRMVENAIISAYMRRKQRLLVFSVFRRWRHQALYADTGALYTRNELVHNLKEQKKLVLFMTESVEAHQAALEETKALLSAETAKSNDLTSRLTAKAKTVIELRFANHQIENELVKAHTLIDAITMIHPGTIKRLKGGENEDAEPSDIVQAARAGLHSNVEVEKVALSFFDLPKTLTESEAESHCIPMSARRADDQLKYRLPPLVLPRKPSQDEMVEGTSFKQSIGIDLSEEKRRKSPRVSPEDLVWVTKEDADIILRAKWAFGKIISQSKELTRKDDDVASPGEKFVKRASDEEAWHLRSILAHLFTGDKRVLEMNKWELKRFFRNDADQEVEDREAAIVEERAPTSSTLQKCNQDVASASVPSHTSPRVQPGSIKGVVSGDVHFSSAAESIRRPIDVPANVQISGSANAPISDGASDVNAASLRPGALEAADVSSRAGREQNRGITDSSLDRTRPDQVSQKSGENRLRAFDSAEYFMEKYESLVEDAVPGAPIASRKSSLRTQMFKKTFSGKSKALADTETQCNEMSSSIPDARTTETNTARGSSSRSATAQVPNAQIPNTQVPHAQISKPEPHFRPRTAPAAAAASTQLSPTAASESLSCDIKPETNALPWKQRLAPLRPIHLTGLEAMRHISRSRIDRSTSWNDFAQGLLCAFPLKHPANVSVKSKMTQRLAGIKDTAFKNKYADDRTNRPNIFSENAML